MKNTAKKRKPKHWISRYYEANFTAKDLLHEWFIKNLGFIRYCTEKWYNLDVTNLSDRRIHDLASWIAVNVDLGKGRPNAEMTRLAKIVDTELQNREAILTRDLNRTKQFRDQLIRSIDYKHEFDSQILGRWHEEPPMPAVIQDV